MSTSVNAILNLSLSGNVIGNAILGQSPQYSLSQPGLINVPMTNGTGYFKVNQAAVYAGGPLAPGASIELSMFALSTNGTDVVDNQLTTQSVKVLVIQNLANSGTVPVNEADQMLVYKGASNPWVSGPLFSAGTLVFNGGASHAFIDPGAQGYVAYGTNCDLVFKSPATNPDPIYFNVILLGATATQ